MIHYFQSSQAGAPQLTGLGGSVIAILNACLINGFNLRTLNGTEDQLSFLVDYEHASLDLSAPDFEAVPGWLDAAHTRIELAFYGSFTPTCHAEVFQEARDE